VRNLHSKTCQNCVWSQKSEIGSSNFVSLKTVPSPLGFRTIHHILCKTLQQVNPNSSISIRPSSININRMFSCWWDWCQDWQAAWKRQKIIPGIACNKACLDFGGKIKMTPTGSFRVQIMINNKLESWHTALDRNGAHKQDQR